MKEIAPPKVETVPLGKLKPWEHNPRIGHAVDKIAASIEAFGYLSPIVVQAKTYRVLSGHGRLKALKKQGHKNIPVIVADINDRNADLYTVADNKLTDLSTFDFKMTAELLKGFGKLDFKLTGFDEAELEELLGAERDIDDAAGVAGKLRRVSFYAGEDETEVHGIMNDRTLVVVFENEQQLGLVKKRIHEMQAGNQKSIGDIIYAHFCKSA